MNAQIFFMLYTRAYLKNLFVACEGVTAIAVARGAPKFTTLAARLLGTSKNVQDEEYIQYLQVEGVYSACRVGGRDTTILAILPGT